MKLAKDLKFNFFEKVVVLVVKEFHGLQDDLKII